MKKSFAFFLLILTAVVLAVQVHAASPKIVDQADLLSSVEEASLEAQANSLVEQYDMDVVIVTTISLDGKSAQAYADDYFDENGYGIGSDYSGVLFLICTDGNYWAVSTCGETIYALTDYAIECIFEEVRPSLSSGDFFQAFEIYLNELAAYFDSFHQEAPIDGFIEEPIHDVQPDRQEEVVYYEREYNSFDFRRLCFTVIVSAAIAGIVLYFMKRGMNTVRAQRNASNYMQSGSFLLTENRDMFLYSRTSRVAKSDNHNGGGGRSGGGSSIHHSSSGRNHGGRSGRF